MFQNANIEGRNKTWFFFFDTKQNNYVMHVSLSVFTSMLSCFQIDKQVDLLVGDFCFTITRSSLVRLQGINIYISMSVYYTAVN